MSRGESRLGKKRFPAGWLISAILLVIAAVALFVHRSEALKESALAESLAYEESVAESLALMDESVREAELPEFAPCEDQDIIAAIESYFGYRLSADTESLLRLFGRSRVTDDEELKARFLAEASWIQAYDDITVYTAPMGDDGECLGIATYVIDFRRTDEPAPGIMYFFTSYDDDGRLVLTENPLKDKLDFAAEMLSTDWARKLIEETDGELRAALDRNSTLALIYTSFLNGEIYTEQGIDMESEQEVNIYFSAADSVLVDADTLALMEEEAREAASREAALAENDIYPGGDEQAGE